MTGDRGKYRKSDPVPELSSMDAGNEIRYLPEMRSASTGSEIHPPTHGYLLIEITHVTASPLRCAKRGRPRANINFPPFPLLLRRYVPMTTTEPDYMTTYRETWADLVETDGKLDLDKVARELSDYWYLLDQVPQAYDAVTGGRVSKPNTAAHAVEDAAVEYANRMRASGVLADLLPQMAHEVDRQAVIDYANDLDPDAYDEHLLAQERRKAVAGLVRGISERGEG